MNEQKQSDQTSRLPQASLLPQDWEVPQIFRDRLGERVGRQRAMQTEGHLLLVLHNVPSKDNHLREGCFFWQDANGKWKSHTVGTGPNSIPNHLTAYLNRLTELDNQLANAESSDDFFNIIGELAPLLRSSHNLHQALQEARQLLPEDREIIDFRDRAYMIERTAELLYQDSKNGLDYAIAKQNEEQAKNSQQMAIAAHRLNVLAAFFFPIATLSAIFGVNLQHGYETIEGPTPFLIVLGIGLFTGLILKMYITRKGQ